MFVQLALLAAQMFLGIVTSPRPKRVSFEEFLEANKGDETRPIPYIRGKWKTTPQRIWLGDYSTRAVERDSHWSDYLFFGIGGAALLDFITVAYTYHVGQVLALTWGPINRVSQVYVEDLLCMVPPTSDNAGGSLLLDFPTAFGGDQPPGQGGVYGVCDVLPGTYTQARNPYLFGIEGNIPALHGVAALVVRGRTGFDNYGYFAAAGVGGAPSLRTWQVEVMAWPDNFGTGVHRLPDDSYNRLDVLYEWTTKPDYGAEYPVSNIHFPSWLAAQQTTYDEGNGFSGEINTGSLPETIAELKASIDAEFYEHPSDGLKIKLIRKDYSIPSLTVLDESNTNSVEEYTPGDYADSYNRVMLEFINGDNNYQPRPAIYEDPANFHIQRRVATKEVNYPGVTSATVAQQLVTRDGRMLGQPWPPLVLNAGEDGRNLWPGEAFKFQWPNPLLSKIFRVSSRTPSVSYDGEKNFRIVSTEDQYSTGLAAFGAPSDTDAVNPANIFNTAPASAVWDTALYPPNGLIKGNIVGPNPVTSAAVEELTKAITGGIIFTTHSPGQYARLYVTVPGGVQTLTPAILVPDADNKATFVWPSVVQGNYIFCVETYSHNNITNGVKVCATMGITGSSPSASDSPSASASVSPSSSVSPSVSPSASVSRSVSPSSSLSPSISASISPSASVSPSSSASASVSPSSSVSPSAAGVLPTDVPNCELWLPVSSITGLSDDVNVDTWPDMSGNGRDATRNNVAGDGPHFRTSGGPTSGNCVRFSTAPTTHPRYFTLPDFLTGFSAGEGFAVIKLDQDPITASSEGGPPFGDFGSSTTGSVYPFTDGIIYDEFGTTVRKTTNNPTTSLATWHLFNVRSASGSYIWSINAATSGNDFFSTGTNTVGWGTAPRIGADNLTNRSIFGLGVEFIFFSRILDDATERKAIIHQYLNDAYGFSLPT